jgi:hypothetical protein
MLHRPVGLNSYRETTTLPASASTQHAPLAPFQVVMSPVVVPMAGLGSIVDLVEMDLEGGRGPDCVLLLDIGSFLHFRMSLL